MPEGHVIHRLAAELDDAFAGRPVAVSSPQGRFAAAAELLDGARFTGAQAHGKHLFLQFGENSFVHVHLGLIGKLRWVAPGERFSPGTVRLRVESPTRAVELRGPQTCS
ncbi:MAG: DNA-formamidopyrimidine glycosylase family protein, partial [Propionicimonas sp.]